MIIKPKRKPKENIGSDLYCARCGKIVPFEKKYLTHYFQQKLISMQRWIVHVGYICPFCGTPTSIVVTVRKNQHEKMKKVNLYGEY